MTRNKNVSIMWVAMLLVAIVVISGGCGGGGSNAPSNHSPKTEETVLLDALREGSIVEIDLMWDGEMRTLGFKNVGEELFQKITLESDDLIFEMTWQQYGILNLDVCNPKYPDEWIQMNFNCSGETYTLDFSLLLRQMLYHLYGFLSIRVNGDDLTNSIEGNYVERDEKDDTTTLKDIEYNSSTATINVFLNNVFHQVIFRNVNGTFELIDGKEEEFQMVTMTKSDDQWLNVFFEVDDSLWMSIRYYYADNTYEVNVAEGYSGKMEKLYINGIDITEDLTWKYNWWDPNGRPARIEDILQKNTQVLLSITWEGEIELLTYLNIDGNNHFSCDDNTDLFSSCELSANEENAVFTFVSKENTEKWMTITFTYASGTYHIEYSSMISEIEKFGLVGISVNCTNLTDDLLEV